MKRCKIEHRAKKRYGQHFLNDKSVMDKIIESMPAGSYKVVEIGPGLGDLTDRLLACHEVVAYEIDDDLRRHLESRFAGELKDKRLKVYFCDVLDVWECGGLEKEQYALVANLPYYIATNIILRALKDKNCNLLTVMVQKEVAEKFAASPGERQFSGLSVLASSCGEARVLFDIQKESFSPPPKVLSSILEIKKERSLEDEGFSDFLKLAFSQPRKKLISSLSRAYQNLQDVFVSLGIDERSRAHQLEPMSYHLLYKRLKGG